MVGVQAVVSRGARHARATFSGFARRRPSTGGKRGRRALPLVRPDGCSAHPPATARSAAELGARCVSFSLCGPSLWMGGHPPTEIVRPRLAPPTLPILRSKGDGHRVAVGWLSAGRGGDLRPNRGVDRCRVSRVQRAATLGQPFQRCSIPASPTDGCRRLRREGDNGPGAVLCAARRSVCCLDSDSPPLAGPH